MYYLICFDISDDRLRRNAGKKCKQAGLLRIQRSVFIGHSQPHLIGEVRDYLLPLLDAHTDSLAIQPLDRPAYRQLSFYGKKYNKQHLAREQKVIFI